VWLPAACLQQRQSGKKAALVLRSSLIMLLGCDGGNEVEIHYKAEIGKRFLVVMLQVDNL